MKRCSVTAIALIFLTFSVFGSDLEGHNPARLVSDWNAAILTIAEAEDNFLTLKGVRTAAMMHVAMHDALAAIDGRYEPYAYHQAAADAGADPVAAATQAAFDIAMRSYPDQAATFQGLRDKWMERVASDVAAESGKALGSAAADAVLAARLDDGWDTEADYQWHPMGPGVYAEFSDHSGTPEGFIFGAAWGKAKGFALQSADQFRSPPPPEIDSAAYTQAFNEVRTLGRFQSMQRSNDQTHIALWWKDFSESSHNRLARQLVAKEELPLVESARLFALINMGIYDAYISVFDSKFHYNHWRPYTAIRWAANDGNADTIAEETWTNTHRHTYPFPSYPSAHGTACTAAMTAIASVFGDQYEFTMRTEMVDVAGPFSGKIEMQPATRSFKRFSDAGMECALSRVYLGIHFRYDSVAGFEMGKQVGRNVVDNLLRSTPAD